MQPAFDGHASINNVQPQEDLRRFIVEFLRIVIGRKVLILTVMAACLSIATLRTYLTTPLYSASIRLQIETKAATVVEGGQVEPIDNAGADFLRTQLALLQSRALAERAVSLARLGDDADFFKARESAFAAALKLLLSARSEAASNSTASERETAAVPILMENLVVRPIAGSRLVDVLYSDPSPERARKIADAIGEAFIASNFDKRLQASVHAKLFLEDQLGQLRLRLEDAEKSALDFAAKEEFVVTNDKASISEANLGAANAALGGLVAERIKAEQLWRQVENVEAVDLPQFLLNPVIQGLRASRKSLETEYKEKLETFKPSYPAMVQIRQRLQEIDRQVANELKVIKGSYRGAFEQAARQQSEMEARIETLRLETLDLQKRSIRYNNLQRETATTRRLYEGLLQRYKEIDVAGSIGASNIFVIDKAVLPRTPSSPNLGHALLLALGVGVFGGVGAAYLLERLEDTVRTPAQSEQLTGLPTLSIVPLSDRSMPAEHALSEPTTGLSEAYRSLATTLQYATDEGLPKSLVITSACPGEGKSLTSLAIARNLGAIGLRVLLIDADLRNPSLHRKLGADNAFGLSDVLRARTTTPGVFQDCGLENVTFMASGPLPSHAADLLAGPRLRPLLTSAAQSFDITIMDAPPVMGLADVPILAGAASATLFVIGSGQSRPGQIEAALRRLHLARCAVLGTVLTRFDGRDDGYGYEYAYRYGAQTSEALVAHHDGRV